MRYKKIGPTTHFHVCKVKLNMNKTNKRAVINNGAEWAAELLLSSFVGTSWLEVKTYIHSKGDKVRRSRALTFYIFPRGQVLGAHFWVMVFYVWLKTDNTPKKHKIRDLLVTPWIRSYVQATVTDPRRRPFRDCKPLHPRQWSHQIIIYFE